MVNPAIAKKAIVDFSEIPVGMKFFLDIYACWALHWVTLDTH